MRKSSIELKRRLFRNIEYRIFTKAMDSGADASDQRSVAQKQ